MFLRVTWYFYFGVTIFKFAAEIQLSVVSCSTSVFFLSCFKLWQEINDQDIRPGNFICLQPNSLARASLKMRKHDTSPLVPFVFTADCKIAFACCQCQMYSYIRLEILRACELVITIVSVYFYVWPRSQPSICKCGSTGCHSFVSHFYHLCMSPCF